MPYLKYIRQIMIALVAMASIAATVFAFTTLRQAHRAEHYEAFIHQADLHRIAVEEGLLVAQDLLHASKGLFESTEHVSRAQFKRFSSALLARARYIQALEWIPHIPAELRAAYEERARQDGLTEFRFREKRRGDMVPAANRDEYYPVYYVTPMIGNEAALGFDLGSNSARREALEKARDTGEPVMSRSVTLVQEAGNQAGVLIFLPVYNAETAPITTKERRAKLKGFVLLVLRVGDLISGTRSNIKNSLSTRVTDVGTGDVLHDEINETLIHNGHQFRPIQRIAGRMWQFQFQENDDFPVVDQYFTDWIVLIGLLTIIALAGTLMFQMERQTRQVSRIVKERTEQLHNSEQRFALAAKGASVGIWDWFDSAEDRVYFSPRYFQIMGMQHDGNIGSANMLRQRIHPDDLDDLEQAMRDQAQTNDRLDHEVRILTHKGQEKWIRVAATITRSENSLGYRRVGTIEDIDQRKQAEMQAAAYASALQRSNEELEQFVYVASHDLKAPLRGIRTLAEWIEENVADTADEETRRYLELLKSRTERLDGLLEGLLSYARAGAETRNTETLDLNALTDEISDLLDLDSKGFSVKRNLPTVNTSKIVMAQVLQNLISNAIKHHDQGQGHIEIDHQMLPDHYLITVTDDGPGIPDDMAERVFRMFHTLRPRDQIEGSGMGLAIIRKLMISIGGEISVDTTYDGRGTRFRILVPFDKPPEPGPDTGAVSGAAPGPGASS